MANTGHRLPGGSYKYHQRDESDNTYAAMVAENTYMTQIRSPIINEILDVKLSAIQMCTSTIMESAVPIIGTLIIALTGWWQ